MKTKFANHASHVAVQGNLVTDMDSSIETVSEHIDETRDALVDMRTPEKTQGFKDRFDDALLAINEQLKQGQVPTLDFDTIFDVNGGEQKDKDIAQIGRDLIDEAAKEATSEFEFIRLLEHKLVQAQASGDFLFTLDQSQLIMTVIEYIPVVYPKSYTDGKLQKILATGKMTNDQK